MERRPIQKQGFVDPQTSPTTPSSRPAIRRPKLNSAAAAEKQAQAEKFPPLASYIKADGHLKMYDDDGSLKRIVPAPFQRPARINKPGPGASGMISEFEFADEIHQEVEIMAWAGLTVQAIADAFKVDRTVIERNFREAVISGGTRVNYALARTMLMKGLRGDTIAGIFSLKSRAGWIDTPREASVTVETQDRLSVAVKAAPEVLAALFAKVPGLRHTLFNGKPLAAHKDPLHGETTENSQAEA